MNINLKNYTTTVAADRSISLIEKMLVEFGATNINKRYNNQKQCSHISFLLTINGVTLAYMLPANIGLVQIWLSKKRTSAGALANKTQAYKIAWKMQHDILHLQLSQITMGQLDVREALLSYTYDPVKNQTFYEKIKNDNYKLLINDFRQD